MTFEEFQATRKPASLNEMYEAGATPFEETVHGLLYAGSLFIESTEGWGTVEQQTEGRWHLLIERSEYISDDLEALERILYDWGIDAGNITIDELCSFCRCHIPSGEGLRIGNDIFCSESCKNECQDEEADERPLPEAEFQALMNSVQSGELKIEDIVVPPPTRIPMILEDGKKKTEEFVAMVARMRLTSEMTEDERMTGDDSTQTLDELIKQARRLL